MIQKSRLGVLLAACVIALVCAVMLSGCGKSTGLKVAFLGPLSGDAASFGTSQKNGIEVALQEVNAAGGINGTPVSVVYEDTQLDQNKAIAAFNKVVDSDGAKVVLGDSSSANTMAIGPLAKRKDVLLLSPIASSASLTKSGFPIFRVSPSDAFQARIASRYAINQGWKTAAIIYTNDEWGTGLKEEFSSNFAALGGKVIDASGIEPKSQDFRPQLTRLKSQQVEFVYIPLHPDEAVVALKQARQLGLKTQFVGADSFSEPTIAKAAGQAADGVIYTVPAAGYGTAYSDFAKSYKTKFGEEPNYNAAAGYDSLRIIVEAAKKAGSFDRSALAKALSEQSAFEGASGTIVFDKNGDVVSKAFDIKKLQNGKPTTIKAKIEVSK